MRNLKKVIVAVLSAALIATCAPSVPAPTISYAASATDYTSATDLPLNQIQMLSLPKRNSESDDGYVWYKFEVNPKSEIQVTVTELDGNNNFFIEICHIWLRGLLME